MCATSSAPGRTRPPARKSAGAVHRVVRVPADVREHIDAASWPARIFPATHPILGPFLWQIQTIIQWHAAVRVGARQTHRDLTVLCLAQSTAVLPCHAHRMPSLFYMRRVIEDPPAALLLLHQLRSDSLRHYTEPLVIFPIGRGYQVFHRLMYRAHILRAHARRHRLDALSFTGQQ